MSKFIIHNSENLQGEISVYGAKNAAMKIIAATVLISGKVILDNVPDILDVQIIIDILKNNGAKISRRDHILKIDTANLSGQNPDATLVKKMRGAIVLIGPYLARFNHITVPHPGGCVIGTRPIDIHLDAFAQMGAVISEVENDSYLLTTPGLKSPKVTLKGSSVTATENILMAAVLGSGRTVLENAACEPEIVDLANFLNQAGAKITGAGTSIIEITGVHALHGVNYKIMPDRIETGTFAALAIVTKSNLKITHCRPEHLTAFFEKLDEIGVNYKLGRDFIEIKKSTEVLRATDFETAIYPGFPTDLQAPMGLILTLAQGQSHIKENIFENRLTYLKDLNEMGARAEIINEHEASINGPSQLHGTEIEGPDLRAGVTLLLAGLCADGQTTISNAEIVDRGYEQIETRLKRIGAKIERVDS